MAECDLCHGESPGISRELGVCLACIRRRPAAAVARAMEAHRRSRAAFGLPETAPKDPKGASCRVCVHECRIPQHEVGYCGLRRNEAGKVKDVTAQRGKLAWYYDPLPTNCVGAWVCAGCSGTGYPKYAHCRGAEIGHRNLAVFFQACSFNCLFCQNWEFRREAVRPFSRPVEALVDAVDERTSCICYFGGDPAPQISFSLRASRLARERHKGCVLRLCWETNGSMHPGLLDHITELALTSGGCVKFDLKAWDDNLHIAMTGVSNRRTLENFARAAARSRERPKPPLAVASTLLVPGYIDEEEVAKIASFITSINPRIPYSLLGFHPHFHMRDLPLTLRAQAERCRAAALEAGLSNVHLGNVNLLA